MRNPDPREPLLILTVGGLGDLLCAEPAIRYGIESVFTQSKEIVIVTKNSTIFNHLLKDKRVRFITEEELYKDLKSYHGYSVCATYDHPLFMKKGIIQGALHSTDYASIYLLGRLVPEEHKKIYIDKPTALEIYSVSEKFRALGIHYSDTLLIHPGETWPSRTIPVEWWEEFIKEYKGSMCLVGQHRPLNVPLMTESPSRIPEETKELHRDYIPGVLDLNVTIPNLIDKLSYRELVTAIYLCKGIITNDSVPIHIAGAFNNWLFTFATTKEWSILKPFNHDKSINFSKECLYPANHFRPTKLIGSQDLIPPNITDLTKVIESPQYVSEYINTLWKTN